MALTKTFKNCDQGGSKGTSNVQVVLAFVGFVDIIRHNAGILNFHAKVSMKNMQSRCVSRQLVGFHQIPNVLTATNLKPH